MRDDFPQFGELRCTLVVNEEVYFHVRLLKTLCLSEHYHAYVTEEQNSYKTIKHAELCSYLPLHLRHVSGLTRYGQKAIVLKHHISTL